MDNYEKEIEKISHKENGINPYNLSDLLEAIEKHEKEIEGENPKTIFNMNNFEKWKNDLTLEDFKLTVACNLGCPACPARNFCKSGKGQIEKCLETIETWAKMDVKDKADIKQEGERKICHFCSYRKDFQLYYRSQEMNMDYCPFCGAKLKNAEDGLDCGSCPAYNFCHHREGLLISDCKGTLKAWREEEKQDDRK